MRSVVDRNVVMRRILIVTRNVKHAESTQIAYALN